MSVDLNYAMLYLSYIIRRSGESAESIRADVGPVADFLESRYQDELYLEARRMGEAR